MMMASENRSDHPITVSAKLCTCSLCQDNLKQPRILTCFHTFCSECLEHYISKQISLNGQRTFSCPVCSRTTLLPEGSAEKSFADGLKLDTFTAKLSEVLEAYKDDKKCDICKRREVQVIASAWCMDCYDAFCEDCTKVHLCGKATCDHVVISMTELRKLSLENVMRRTSSQSCTKHQEDLVKLYCLDCGEPVCVQCLTSSHKKCEQCLPVSEARKLVQDDVTKVMVRVRTVVTESSNEKTPFQNGVNSLDESIKKTEAEIRFLADDLRRRITQSEEALIDKLHSASSQQLQKTGDVHNATESRDDDFKILRSAENRMNALLKYGSDLDILDIYHSVKDTLSRVDKRSSGSSSSAEAMVKVTFEIDETMKNFCRDFVKLGEIRVEDSSYDEGLSSWGVTVTSRDEIIVADGRNKRVQKFTSNGSLIDHIQLHEQPRDLTSFGQHDVAITITKRQIFVVDVLGNMELKRRIDTQRQYDGIGFYPPLRCFLVSSVEENCIDLITAHGEVTKTFNVNANTLEPIFVSPRYVAFTKEGHYVVSDTTHNSVTCISHDGALLFTYAPSDGAHAMKKAQGVCCDMSGNIFVGDYGNSRINLLTSDGHFQRFVLGHDSELKRPVALAMTQSNKLVVVQSDGMVKIFSYEGNRVQDEGHENNNGQPGHGRYRFHSSTSPGIFRVGRSSRSLSESSEARYPTSTLSPHTFRSRHF